MKSSMTLPMKKVGSFLFRTIALHDRCLHSGSSVIRLLHAYIGNEAFRTGLANYLAEYAYKNTITENLWSHLSRAANRPQLSEILSTWTKKMGYPLLIVSVENQRDFSSIFLRALQVSQEQKGNDRLLTIEQTRFLADGSTDDQSTWKIPISVCTKSNPNENIHQLYLDDREKKQQFLLEKVPERDWIKLNLFR